jgi:hypothetical protein
MNISCFCILRVSTLVSIATLALSSRLCAQVPLPNAPMPSARAVLPLIATPPPRMETSHEFWDKPNQILFVAAAAGNAADFAVTRTNLQSGGRELNPIVRTFGSSSAGLAMNFVGETAGVISLSYFFHKTGHHKLERAVSLVNIGSSTGAVAYGLSHR